MSSIADAAYRERQVLRWRVARGKLTPKALVEQHMKLSLHTAPDAPPLTITIERSYLAHGLLPSPVGPRLWLSKVDRNHCEQGTWEYRARAARLA